MEGWMAALFPMFLKLEGRKCVVVGAGRIAAQKIKNLMDCATEVNVIAPVACREIQELARNRSLTWTQTEFKAAHLAGSFMVIAATSNPAVNEQVYRAALKRGVPLQFGRRTGEMRFLLPCASKTRRPANCNLHDRQKSRARAENSQGVGSTVRFRLHRMAEMAGVGSPVVLNSRGRTRVARADSETHFQSRGLRALHGFERTEGPDMTRCKFYTWSMQDLFPSTIAHRNTRERSHGYPEVNPFALAQTIDWSIKLGPGND
jgi:hypothetical protein